MKIITVRTIVLLALLWGGAANAALIGYNFDWTGNGGYSAEGMITVDDTFSIASADGLGATNGIESLMVDFFDPSNTLIQSTTNVAGGISTYNFLFVRFDTVLGDFDFSVDNFFGLAFDIGADPGFFLVQGSASGGQVVLTTGNLTGVDRGGEIIVTPKAVPLPSTLALLFFGLLALRRRIAV